MFEIYEHTADLGLRVRAASLGELFAEAGQGLSSLIVADCSTIQCKVPRHIEILGEDREFLFFDWLNELLYIFENERLLFSEFQVRVSASGVVANVRGERLDRTRHRLEHEVKAITYHGLKVEMQNDAWLAELIVDI